MSEDRSWYYLKEFGYAPGNYMNSCIECKKIVEDVDKRACRCRPCATALAEETSREELANYQPGKWFMARSVDLIQKFYEQRLPFVREAAKEHGYAIGAHGSMRRDMDLIAVPWTDVVSTPDVLAHAIAVAACGITREGNYEWEKKPLGRIATSIPICWTHRPGHMGDGHLDLSVTPAVTVDLDRVRRLEQRVAELTKWKHSMSYNDSYFGEPAGLLKQVTAELDRLLPTTPDQTPYSGVTEIGKQIMEAAKCTCLTNQLGPHYCEKCSP